MDAIWEAGMDLMEDSFELVLANPQRIKNVPGKKQTGKTYFG